MLRARRYVVSGRVQGVGFRMFVRDAALREGLRGWVRNQPDRTVELVAQGDAEALQRFEMVLRGGLPGARIDDVTADQEPVAPALTSFVIHP